LARAKNAWTRALLVLALAVLVPLLPFVAIGELPGERWLLASTGDALRFGATGAALLAADLLLPIPSSVIGALLGGRLGLWAGFGWTFAGLCAGHAVGYALGRLAPARFASELPDAPSLGLVLLSRPVPVLAEAVALASGAVRMPPARYFAAVALGNAAYAGALAGGGAALLPGGLAGPGLVLPLLLPVVAYAIYRARATRSAMRASGRDR
jgi:membrane protein YqaA with SNARE-associated domain